MSAYPQTSEMLGQFINGRFIPRMAGGEDDPPAGDPPAGDDPPTGKDGKPFDADRAQRTIDQLRAQVEDKDKASKAAARDLAAAQARLKEIDDASKSETEKLASKAAEASEKLTAAEARAQDLAIRLAVAETASGLGISGASIKAAVRLLDHSALEFGDDGAPINVEAALKALVKEYPMLVAEDVDKDAKPRTEKVPNTPKPNGRTTSSDVVRDEVERMRATGRYTI